MPERSPPVTPVITGALDYRQTTIRAPAVIGPDVGQPLDGQVGARQVRDNPSKLREAFVLVDGWNWLAIGAVFYDRDETMDEDSDSFEVIVSIEQVGDGAARVVRSVERHPDGSEIVTEYEEALPYNDPYVRSRQRTVGDGPPGEIVTEFLPSPVRPPTYPAGFPFLPGRASHTTESPAHQMSPGVRWRCDDPDTVLTALIDMSLAEGWTAMDASNVEPLMRENLKAAFRRGNDVRQFSRIELDQGSIVSMLELPGDW